jgi:type II secretory pathway pseudopilin PulG
VKLLYKSRTVQEVSRRDSGYILLTLLFFVAVLAIVAASMAPLITFEIKRGREEEMIHRGVQYSRAVRRYYKKFGRYPTRIEDLENTNNLRFLRKRYKDPITGQDFKLLHFGDVKMSFGAGIAGAMPAGAAGQGPPGAFGSQNGFGAQNGFGNQGGGPGPNRPGGAFGGFGPAGTAGVMNQTNLNQNGANAGTASDASNQAATGPTTAGAAGTATTSGDSTSNANNSSGNDASGSNSQNGNGSGNGQSSANQVFGGGPIVGVVSASEKDTIREFNKKHHYNEWQFIYDPNSDRGGLLNTPNQPALQGVAGQQPGQNGVPAAPGTPAQGSFGQSPFGQPASFGQPTPPPPQAPPTQGPSN